MTDGFHECFAAECTRRIPAHLLMCGTHWRQVPPETQQEVYDANSAKRNAKPPNRFAAYTRWARACQAARRSLQ